MAQSCIPTSDAQKRSSRFRRCWEVTRLGAVASGALAVLLLGMWLFDVLACCAYVGQAVAAAPSFRQFGAHFAENEESGTIPPPTGLTQTVHLPILWNNLPIYLPLLYGPVASLPEPLTPVPGSVNQSPNTFLEWRVDTMDDAPFTFEVYLDADTGASRMRVFHTTLQTTYIAPGTLALDTWYHWRVAVINARGERTWGPEWSFHVEPFLYPPAIGAMIQIPAGEFMMGCDRAVEPCNEQKERPLHPVYLDTYEIDKYEVTNREYRACVDANVCEPPRLFSSRHRSDYFYNPEYDYYPVMYVSWWNAQTYCEWMDKRLPTEAEWEKAARGPIDTRIWPWGNEDADCSRANFYVKCVGDTEPVGSHPTGASPYGVMDMSGSMFEWVHDRYVANYYTFSPYTNPQGPGFSRPNPNRPGTSHPYFVIRGGSYHDNWWYSRVAHRHWGHHGDRPGHDSPNYRSFRVGIRCARSVTEQALWHLPG